MRRHGTIDIECEGQSRPGNHNGMFGTHRSGEANPFFGKNHTDESKEKMSVANLGRKHTEEQNKANSDRLKGRSNYWLKGKPMSEEQKEKLRINVPRGKDSPHWKGGITPENRAIRSSPTFKNWARQVKERDNYTCQECGKVGGELHSDHILPFYNNPELRFELSNGRTLCIACHRLTDSYGRPERRLVGCLT